jgi:sulfur carrier protein
MNVTINGKTDTLEHADVTILDLLRMKEVEMPDMVSVQLNGDILDRAAFDSTTVADGDEVEFLYFMGGGAA